MKIKIVICYKYIRLSEIVIYRRFGRRGSSVREGPEDKFFFFRSDGSLCNIQFYPIFSIQAPVKHMEYCHFDGIVPELHEGP